MHTVSTWGNNANSSLGHEHSRMFPETLSMPVDKDVGQVRHFTLKLVDNLLYFVLRVWIVST